MRRTQLLEVARQEQAAAAEGQEGRSEVKDTEVSQDLALRAERLRDDLEEFRRKLRKRYLSPSAQVASAGLKKEAAALAERGLVGLTAPNEFAAAVGAGVSADLSIEFQRLLSAAGKSATRRTYDAALGGILPDFASRVVVPLKRTASAAGNTRVTTVTETSFPAGIFLGHSFAAEDAVVVECVKDTLELLGATVITGERPRADRISDKVKGLIDAQPIFAGLFTRRDKVSGRREWTSSPWVVEEKAYAVAKKKKLVLFKEDGIASIGGIQGDYEYIEFSRDALHTLVIGTMRMFSIAVRGFAE